MRPSAYRKLVLGGLVAALGAWVVIPRLLGGAAPRTAHAAEAEDAGSAESEADWVPPVVNVADVTGLAPDESATVPWPEDPFFRRHLAANAEQDQSPAAQVKRAGPVLSAVVDGPMPWALINGRIVTVGDQLADDSVVLAINTDSVTLSGPEGTWTLKLPE